MICARCFEEKNVEEFYKSDRTCKICRCERVRKYRKKRIEQYTRYERDRNALPHRVAARAAYQKTEAGKASLKRCRKKWLATNPDKRAAHIILGNAVRDGRIERPDSCSVCERADCRIHGHHDDYTKPLEVRWVCPQCHTDIHSGDYK